MHLYSSGFLVNTYLPVNTPPYITLLEVENKCFHLSTKCAFTGIYGLLEMANDKLLKYKAFTEMK